MDTMTGTFFSRLRLRLRSERGFTLIEMMVAIGVILVALLAMAYTATIGFSDIALARQRQSANGLANQTIEQVRALPFDTLRKGLDNGDLSDPNISINTCGLPPPDVYCYGGEQIPTGSNPAVVPLVPHQRTIPVGPTTYTVSTYVTYYNNDPTANAFRITAVVTWANPARRGVSAMVQTQTIAFSGQGCLSTSTHPFAGPCQPFFYGNASIAEGHVEITGQIADIAFEKAQLLFPWASSNIQVEQISAAQGIAQASGVTLKLLNQAEQISGSVRETSGADNDPVSEGANEYDTQNLAGSGGPLTAVDGNGRNSITVSPSSGDSGSTTSTTSASIVNPVHPCPLSGISENDQQPCGSSEVLQVGATSATVVLRKNTDLGSIPLLSVAAAPVKGSSFTHRELQMDEDGLVHSDVSRSLGAVTIGGLPSNVAPGAVPPGWLGYLVRIDNFTDTVTAEAGTNTAAPAVTASGSISYWNGAGYSVLSIAPGPGLQIPVSSVQIADNSRGKLLEVVIQGGVDFHCDAWVQGCPTTGGTSTSSTPLDCMPVPCPTTRTQATAKSNSPFVGDIHYTVIYDGETLAHLTIRVDLGTITAQNTYQPAPSSG
jgi:prepilin-type N-terminal cleavage/methylation domain-containing protein